MAFVRIAKVAIFAALIVTGTALAQKVETGAEQMDQYLPMLEGQKVGLVANHTSRIGKKHLLDTLLAKAIKVKRVFAPEHGFRGNKGAGEKVTDERDEATGIPIVSLYGNQKKPSDEYLKDLDYMVFDIQDVGCRFYTYISSLHYVMEACAENGVPLLVLDRPNPNGYYIDGPVLEEAFSSFVGMHPVPIVYGMTIGEYARMINGEGWLKNGIHCDLEVQKLRHYDHETRYDLPTPPSPNLPNMEAIELYPSLCLFEGTDVSVGRGTDWPFQVIGKPGFEKGDFTFTPESRPGVAPNPPYEGVKCRGYKLNDFCQEYIQNSRKIYLYWLTGFYKESDDQEAFFKKGFFDKLAGTDQLRKKIQKGLSEQEIRRSWSKDIEDFKEVRKQYLLYEDFKEGRQLEKE